MTEFKPIIPPKAQTFTLVLLLLFALILWILLHGPGTDPDGLNYALNMEAGDPAKAFPSDHLLWHGLVWCFWMVAKVLSSQIRPVPIQQFLNLILVCGSIALLLNYLKTKGNQLWTGLCVLLSFSLLKSMIGEDVDAGPILATTVFLFLLPGSPTRPKMPVTILLLAIMPLLHKSLFLLYPGFVLVYLLFSDEGFLKRLAKSLIISVCACAIALAGFWLAWLLIQNGKLPFTAWMASYAAKSTGFWAGDLREVLIGIPIAMTRIFISLTPYKAYASGSWLGLVGVILSSLMVLFILFLAVISIFKGRKEQKAHQNGREILSILIGVAPMLLFFCFWTPGYYTYWSRFLPVFWLVLALRLPSRGWTKIATWALPVLLLAVNVTSLYQAKDGEEAGRLTRWLGETVHHDDLVILGGEGVLFDGKMLEYHLGTNIVMLDYVGKLDANDEFLHERLQDAVRQGRNIWLVADRGRFSSNRLISGESKSSQKGMTVLEKLCTVGEEKRFADPGFEDAGISACSLR